MWKTNCGVKRDIQSPSYTNCGGKQIVVQVIQEINEEIKSPQLEYIASVWRCGHALILLNVSNIKLEVCMTEEEAKHLH